MSESRPSTSPRRIDPRLLVGGALVVASALGGWALVAALDDTVEVVTAATALTPGTRAAADDFATERVRLADATGRYLTPADVPEDGLLVTRTLLEGELVPRSAVDASGGGAQASVVVAAASTLPSGVRPGALVDVWSTSTDREDAAPPSVLVSGASVALIGEPDSAAGGRDERAVELVVPRADLGAVLAALADGDAIDLVPAAEG
ncbi:SAF domain-containing protein [Agromyces seonyuensis]|uniref:SAF domain-containing protein n=1 Tax=Agromyces seonyuensis TaxID=2662446 RepID=A0A6I4P028_9MICO|nr:SAF domain-containing protein [Agromyces seonyuensis]MWB99938.1 hypothetical protein [Agromyces seonyuensis]